MSLQDTWFSTTICINHDNAYYTYNDFFKKILLAKYDWGSIARTIFAWPRCYLVIEISTGSQAPNLFVPIYFKGNMPCLLQQKFKRFHWFQTELDVEIKWYFTWWEYGMHDTYQWNRKGISARTDANRNSRTRLCNTMIIAIQIKQSIQPLTLL
jgi:hypothetical protein